MILNIRTKNWILLITALSNKMKGFTNKKSSTNFYERVVWFWGLRIFLGKWLVLLFDAYLTENI